MPPSTTDLRVREQPTTLKKGFRLDIQGIRTIAVGLVLIYHAGASFLPGGFVGVDVFFVISGFLITGLLLKEVRDTGRISISGFYVRRIKRILPAALLVLVVIYILTVVVLPPTRLETISWQILAATLSISNWNFASGAVNYLNNDAAASPVLHFWSLSVEEQFYIFLPLLLLVALFLARPVHRGFFARSRTVNFRTFRRNALFIGILVTILSFGYSIYLTTANPGAAYFVTTTRVWELGVGVLLAIAAERVAHLPVLVKTFLGWTGFAAVAYSAITFSASTTFPGFVAVIPVGGTALMIAAGIGETSKGGVGTFLSMGPMVWVGNISYSLYLWHWPLVVMAIYLAEDFTFTIGAFVVLSSVIPAYLSFKYIETPIHAPRTHPRNFSKVIVKGGAGLFAVALIPLLTLSLWVEPAIPEPTIAVAPGKTPLSTAGGYSVEEKKPVKILGASLLAIDSSLGVPVDDPGRYSPTALSAAKDNPPMHALGCHADVESTAIKRCVLGDQSSNFVVAVVGDSHAGHWVPALQIVARERGWRLETYTKSSCPLVDIPVFDAATEKTYDKCTIWNENIQKHLAQSVPDLVVTSSSWYSPVVNGQRVEGAERRTEQYSAALTRSWEQLNSAGIPVFSIIDTPYMGFNVPECASANPDQMTRCSAPRSDALRNSGVVDEIAAAGMQHVQIANLNEFICPTEQCPAVIGEVLVYRDSNHLTATYSRTLGPALGNLLDEFVERLSTE